MFNSGFTNKTPYKVIKPFTSHKLHFSSSLEGGASKCYREVKSLMPNSTNFSVMNMTTNELYDYKLNKILSHQSLQTGGLLPSLDIKKIEEKMESLEKRIKTLEDKSEHKIEKLEYKIENSDNELEKTKINNNNLQRSEKIIQASPKASPKASSKNMVIAPGPINSDFAKAFL
jgi:hypothetical protein